MPHLSVLFPTAPLAPPYLQQEVHYHLFMGRLHSWPQLDFRPVWGANQQADARLQDARDCRHTAHLKFTTNEPYSSRFFPNFQMSVADQTNRTFFALSSLKFKLGSVVLERTQGETNSIRTRRRGQNSCYHGF